MVKLSGGMVRKLTRTAEWDDNQKFGVRSHVPEL
jgi:hypothetical protein